MKFKLNVNISKIILYLYTFIVIYTPNFSSNAYVNYLLPFIYMIIGIVFLSPLKHKWKIKGVFYFVAILIGFYIFAAIFFLIRALIAGVEILDIINLRIVQSASIIATIISICKIEHQLTVWGLNTTEKFKFILNVSMIQALIVVFMILNPLIRVKLLNYFYQYGNGNKFTMLNRVYGIMSNYTFSTPIFHGILATLAVTFGIVYDKKIYLYIPFLILMIVLNGRTGMLVFILGIILNIIYFIFKNRYIKKTIVGLFLLVIVLSTLLLFVQKYNPNTYKFLMSGIEDVFNFVFYSEKDGNIEILTDNFNDNVNLHTLIFGNGHKIQNSKDVPQNIIFDGAYSDMGYLNDMYMAGIIYMFLLYIPLILFIIRDSIMHIISDKEKCINDMLKIFLILAVFLCNIKGEIFRSSIIISEIIFLKCMLFDKERENETSIYNNVNI